MMLTADNIISAGSVTSMDGDAESIAAMPFAP